MHSIHFSSISSTSTISYTPSIHVLHLSLSLSFSMLHTTQLTGSQVNSSISLHRISSTPHPSPTAHDRQSRNHSFTFFTHHSLSSPLFCSPICGSNHSH